MVYKGEGEVEIYYIYKKTAKAYLKCKHYQKVCDVNKACRQWNVTCIPLPATAYTEVREAQKENTSVRNEVKTVGVGTHYTLLGDFAVLLRAFLVILLDFGTRWKSRKSFCAPPRLKPSVACMSLYSLPYREGHCKMWLDARRKMH